MCMREQCMLLQKLMLLSQSDSSQYFALQRNCYSCLESLESCVIKYEGMLAFVIDEESHR
jgi:hypothetical protein